MNKKGYEEIVHLSKTNYYVKGGIKSIVNYVDNSNQINVLSATDTVNLTQEIDYMKNCFRKSQAQFNSGSYCVYTGIGLGGIGVLLSANKEPVALPLIGVGGVLSLIGTILMIDSHKWIGKAGLGINGKGNTISVYYRFK